MPISRKGVGPAANDRAEVVAWSNVGGASAAVHALAESDSAEVSAWGTYGKSSGAQPARLTDGDGNELKAWMNFQSNSANQAALENGPPPAYTSPSQPTTDGPVGRWSIGHEIVTVMEDEELDDDAVPAGMRPSILNVPDVRRNSAAPSLANGHPGGSSSTNGLFVKSASNSHVNGVNGIVHGGLTPALSSHSRNPSEADLGDAAASALPSEIRMEAVAAGRRRRWRGCGWLMRWLMTELSGTMPTAAKLAERHFMVEFVDSCLRGVGQVFFMNNPLSGLLFLVGIFYYSLLCGLAAVIGVVSSTGLAYLIGLSHGSIRSGLFGFNGTLVAIGLITFQNPGAENWDNPLVFIPMVLLSALSSLFFVMVGNVLVRHFGLATFTLPFHMCTWLWLLGSQRYAYFPNRSLWVPAPMSITTEADMSPLSYDTEKLLRSIGTNIAQVFFLENDISGYIFVAGVAVCSRISAIMTVYGSAVAVATAVAIGAPQASIYSGLWGFNAVLVSIAIGGMFYVMSLRVAVLATVATIVAVLLFGALSAAFHVIAIPTLTFPGAVVALGFCVLAGAVPGAVPVQLDRMTVPEDHLRRYRLSDSVLSRFAVVRAVARQTTLDSGLLERFLVPVLMCWGAKGGDVKALDKLISLGADPSCADYDGRTPLHIAAAEGKLAAVTLLLDAGADPNATDRYGYRPLDDALNAPEQTAAVIAILRKNGGQVNASRERQAYEMCSLASTGATEKIALRLRAGYGANNADYDGRTALHLAACVGTANAVMTLVAHGADVEALDRYNNTPAEDARLHGHVKLASWLEKRLVKGRGAEGDGTKKGDDDHDRVVIVVSSEHDSSSVGGGSTKGVRRASQAPQQAQQDAAAIRGNAAVISELAAALLSPGVATSPEAHGLAPVLLCAAASSGDETLVHQLCEAGIDPAAADYDGQTALHLAAAAGHGDVIEALIALGCPANPRNRWNETPLDIAVRCGRDGVIALLVSRGCTLALDPLELAGELCRAAARREMRSLKRWVSAGARVGLADYDARTPLHVAASKGHLDTVRYLVASGANPAAQDRWHRTAVADARDGFHAEVVDFLTAAEEHYKEASALQETAKRRAIRRASQQNLFGGKPKRTKSKKALSIAAASAADEGSPQTAKRSSPDGNGQKAAFNESPTEGAKGSAPVAPAALAATRGQYVQVVQVQPAPAPAGEGPSRGVSQTGARKGKKKST